MSAYTFKLPEKLTALVYLLNLDEVPNSVERAGYTNLHDGSTFVCPVCQEVPLHPIMITQKSNPCYHIFCKTCIHNYVINRDESVERTKPRCPTCNGEFIEKTETCGLEKWPLHSSREWQSIEISCPLGCAEKFNIGFAEGHMKYYCKQRIIKCPGTDCYMRGKAQDLEEFHIAECNKFKIVCPVCWLPVSGGAAPEQGKNHSCIPALHQVIKRLQEKEDGEEIEIGPMFPTEYGMPDRLNTELNWSEDYYKEQLIKNQHLLQDFEPPKLESIIIRTHDGHSHKRRRIVNPRNPFII